MSSDAHTESAATMDRIGHVAVITLNRPAAMNAVNAALSTDLGDALAELDSDDELRVGVITGAGRAFCAGVDLKEIAAGRSVYHPDHLEWGFAGLVQHWVDKPLIAAVNGFALGGGTEIMLACDLAVVSEEAKLGLPEVKRGLMAAAGGALRLPRQIPLKLALEVGLTGEPIDAKTALEWGLVNRVVPAGQVVDAAVDLAEKIAANAPLSVRTTKRLMHKVADYGSDWTDEDMWRTNRHEMRELMCSADAKEGPRAFAEKRAPAWRGE